MSETRFTEDHEWVRLGDAGAAEVGITEYAQDQLGELVFVELPEVGSEYAQGAELAVVESVKAAGEVKAPVDGVVREVNAELTDEPAKVNQDPMGGGWIARIELSDPAQFGDLMDEAAYSTFVEGL